MPRAAIRSGSVASFADPENGQAVDNRTPRRWLSGNHPLNPGHSRQRPHRDAASGHSGLDVTRSLPALPRLAPSAASTRRVDARRQRDSTATGALGADGRRSSPSPYREVAADASCGAFGDRRGCTHRVVS